MKLNQYKTTTSGLLVIKVIGRMVRNMVRGFVYIKEDQSMKEISKII
jgi:hypothetical protein